MFDTPHTATWSADCRSSGDAQWTRKLCATYSAIRVRGRTAPCMIWPRCRIWPTRRLSTFSKPTITSPCTCPSPAADNLFAGSRSRTRRFAASLLPPCSPAWQSAKPWASSSCRRTRSRRAERNGRVWAPGGSRRASRLTLVPVARSLCFPVS